MRTPRRVGGEFLCSYANKYSKNRMSVWSPYGFNTIVRYQNLLFLLCKFFFGDYTFIVKLFQLFKVIITVINRFSCILHCCCHSRRNTVSHYYALFSLLCISIGGNIGTNSDNIRLSVAVSPCMPFSYPSISIRCALLYVQYIE